MMGIKKALFFTSLRGCTVFCYVPRYSRYSSQSTPGYGSANPTILNGHSVNYLDKPQGVDHLEINLRW